MSSKSAEGDAEKTEYRSNQKKKFDPFEVIIYGFGCQSKRERLQSSHGAISIPAWPRDRIPHRLHLTSAPGQILWRSVRRPGCLLRKSHTLLRAGLNAVGISFIEMRRPTAARMRGGTV